VGIQLHLVVFRHTSLFGNLLPSKLSKMHVLTTVLNNFKLSTVVVSS
jgi:hypothetical protein